MLLVVRPGAWSVLAPSSDALAPSSGSVLAPWFQMAAVRLPNRSRPELAVNLHLAVELEEHCNVGCYVSLTNETRISASRAFPSPQAGFAVSFVFWGPGRHASQSQMVR